VFAHIHPSGSVPMASLMMVSSKSDSTAKPMQGMDMSGPAMNMSDPSMSMSGMNTSMNMSASTAPLSPELSMPYGFPTPGHYRIFLQFKRANKIETAHFDTAVN
jgi:hypothetical protein